MLVPISKALVPEGRSGGHDEAPVDELVTAAVVARVELEPLIDAELARGGPEARRLRRRLLVRLLGLHGRLRALHEHRHRGSPLSAVGRISSSHAALEPQISDAVSST